MPRILSTPGINVPPITSNTAAAAGTTPAAASAVRDGLEPPRRQLESLLGFAGRAPVPVSPEPPIARRVPGPAFEAERQGSQRDVPRRAGSLPQDGGVPTAGRAPVPVSPEPPPAMRVPVPVSTDPPPASRGRTPAGF